MKINNQFADALGLPKNTRKAVLTLEAGEVPRLEIETFYIDAAKRTLRGPERAAEMVKSIPFIVRLELPKERESSDVSISQAFYVDGGLNRGEFVRAFKRGGR